MQEFGRKIRKIVTLLALAIIVCGFLIALFGVVAPFIGLGRAEKFILYEAYGWTRNDVGHTGTRTILAGVLLGLFIRIPITPLVRFTRFGGLHIRLQIKRLLSASFGSVLKVLAINLIILLVLLAIIEFAVRIIVPESSVYGPNQPGQYFKFQPYMQTSNEGPLDTDGVWYDPLHKEKIPYHVKSNSLGFRIDRELDTTTRYAKKPHERVVLIFGGSSVYGFGNTSNATTSSGYLQKFLNEQGTNGIHYTVFNMGNGGWVSYQELIALNLYGLNLDPDWVIFCDGRNDIFTITGLIGDDVGFHFSTPTMRNYIDGYLYQQKNPDFFRGFYENELIKMSATYRLLTGKQPVVEHYPNPRFPSSRRWSDIDRTVDFYLKTQRSVLRQCDNCQYILSTQPIFRSGRKKLSQSAQAAMRNKYRDLVITGYFTSDVRYEDAIMYADSRIIDETPRVCDAFGPRCRYLAVDSVFPSADAEKSKFFVDDVHLRDEGNALIAHAYAKIILAADGGASDDGQNP